MKNEKNRKKGRAFFRFFVWSKGSPRRSAAQAIAGD